MPYQATPLEWLALSAVAQQPTMILRSSSLRVYLRQCCKVEHPLPFIRDLVRGGLLDQIDGTHELTLTEWGAQVRRAKTPSTLPYYLPIPKSIVEMKLRKH